MISIYTVFCIFLFIPYALGYFFIDKYICDRDDLNCTSKVQIKNFNSSNMEFLCVTSNSVSCGCGNSFGNEVSLLEFDIPRHCFKNESWWLGVMTYYNDGSVESSYPVRVLKNNIDEPLHSNSITLILPVVYDDLSRSLVLLESLGVVSPGTVLEMFMIIPEIQYFSIYKALLASDLGITITEVMKDDFAEVGYSYALLNVKMLPFRILLLNESVVVNSESPLDSSWRDSSRYVNTFLSNSYKYGLQMSLKLLISRFIRTDFYLTLDSDCIALQTLSLNDIFAPFCAPDSAQDCNFHNRIGLQAAYEFESRLGGYHPEWWLMSEMFLWSHGYIPKYDVNKQGFSVTPAILSTIGAQIVVEYIRQAVDTRISLNNWRKMDVSKNLLVTVRIKGADTAMPMFCVSNVSKTIDPLCYWISSFGKEVQVGLDNEWVVDSWTEYTLYRIILDEIKLFDAFHVASSVRERENVLSVDSDVMFLNSTEHVEVNSNLKQLHCYNIWFNSEEDIKSNNLWLSVSTGDVEPAEIMGMVSNCLFSVIQSTANIHVSVTKQLYAMYKKITSFV